ncbi:hypothetical protein HHI36_010348 [Cryptolaemus montrouzieri]|uniref:Uncharacterized protein n=1 Tax=Cryptolaemus montrouzieri TaxID=559131 RepID=A0ABD2MIK3_9CUCU
MPSKYEIVHRKGRDHVVPDLLSGFVQVSADSIQQQPSDFNFSKSSDAWYHKIIDKLEKSPENFPTWRVENGILLKYVKCRIPEPSSTSDYWTIVVPKEARISLIQRCHDDTSWCLQDILETSL